MQAIIDFFVSIIDILASLVSMVVTLVESIVWLIGNLPQLIASVTGTFGFAPTFLFPFLSASIAIMVVIFVVRLI